MKKRTNKTRSKRVIYIMEGEIEMKFFEFLQQKDFIEPGLLQIHNLMQAKIKDGQNILKFNNVWKVYCILDTDCVDVNNLNTLIFNLKKLEQICRKNVFLLIQNKNFEQELSYILSCNNLCKLFKLKDKTRKDLKKHLAQNVDYSKLVTIINLARYCCRPDEFKIELKRHDQTRCENKIVCFENSCMKNVGKRI